MNKETLMTVGKGIIIVLIILAIVFALAGAITKISASSAKDICPGLYSSISKFSTYTSLSDNVCKVNFVTKFKADGVNITLTFAPAFLYKRISEHILYAAIPPVIPTKIVLFSNIKILYYKN